MNDRDVVRVVHLHIFGAINDVYMTDHSWHPHRLLTQL